MHRVNDRCSAQLSGQLALALIGFALAGCSDNREGSSPTSPLTPTPSFQIVPGSGTWTTVAPMPTARGASAAGVINGLIYVVGGSDAAGSATSKRANEAYDPATNTWATKAPDPIANGAGSGVAFAGAGVIAGKLYVVGGCVFADCIPGNTNILEIYDPVANAWTTGASMPTARNMVAAGVIAGKLYVVGGQGQCGPCIPTAVLEVYDPSTNSWASKASMPTARAALSAGVLDGILYAIGGRSGGGASLGTVEAYDPTTDAWTTKAAMSTPRQFATAGVVNGILYAVGGENNGVFLATVEAYDPITNTWTTTASMPTARSGLAAGVVSGSLYAVGGQDASAILATNEALTPAAAPSCVPPPPGMTSWWPGNGNTDDIVGGRNAFLRDNATFGPAHVGDGFVLDGAGDFVEVPDDPALDVGTGDFTVDLWVNFNTTAGEQLLVEKYIENFGGTPPGWFLTKLPDNSLRFGTGPAFSGHGVTSSPVSLPANTWIHFAARRSGGVASIFVNGTEVAAGLFVDNAGSSSSFKLGHRGSPGDTPGSTDTRGFFLNGRIDEVELFVGRALSDAEIQAIFNAGSAGKCTQQPSGTVAGLKFYDANTNGQLDAGEVGIPNWRITFSDGISDSLTTASDGSFGPLSLAADHYTFAERQPLAPSRWIQTGNLADQSSSSGGNASTLNNKIYTVGVLDGGTTSGLNFGNVCVGAGGGHSLGFWSNKNGQALFSGADLALMVSLNLRNANGSTFDPGSYAQFKNWLLNATATNMAYMLSAQLAAMELSVAHGFVNGSTLINASGTNSANANGFATVNDLMSEANTELGLHGLTPSGNNNRPYQEALKNALDKGNNNLSFVQLGPAQCPAAVFP